MATLRDEREFFGQFYGDGSLCEPGEEEETLDGYDEAISLYSLFLNDEIRSHPENKGGIALLKKELQECKEAKRALQSRFNKPGEEKTA